MARLLLRGIHCILLALPAGTGLCSDSAALPAAAMTDIPEQTVVDPDTSSNQQDYDEVTALIPMEQAALASVALAQVNIALYNARLRAQQALCATAWTPNGALLLEYGPQLAEQAPAISHTRSWIYRSLRQPNNIACNQITRSGFFLEMSRHLPGWISIRPAGQQTAYRQGQGVLSPRHSQLAAR